MIRVVFLKFVSLLMIAASENTFADTIAHVPRKLFPPHQLLVGEDHWSELGLDENSTYNLPPRESNFPNAAYDCTGDEGRILAGLSSRVERQPSVEPAFTPSLAEAFTFVAPVDFFLRWDSTIFLNFTPKTQAMIGRALNHGYLVLSRDNLEYGFSLTIPALPFPKADATHADRYIFMSQDLPRVSPTDRYAIYSTIEEARRGDGKINVSVDYSLGNGNSVEGYGFDRDYKSINDVAVALIATQNATKVYEDSKFALATLGLFKDWHWSQYYASENGELKIVPPLPLVELDCRQIQPFWSN